MTASATKYATSPQQAAATTGPSHSASPTAPTTSPSPLAGPTHGRSHHRDGRPGQKQRLDDDATGQPGRDGPPLPEHPEVVGDGQGAEQDRAARERDSGVTGVSAGTGAVGHTRGRREAKKSRRSQVVNPLSSSCSSSTHSSSSMARRIATSASSSISEVGGSCLS